MSLSVTHYSDPGCPWAYSASPAIAVLDWRYGEGLDWRLVTIGLTERAAQYAERGYTRARSARGHLSFRRFGMPFTTEPRRRIPATSRACRAIVAVRLLDQDYEYAAFRALQFGWFTSSLLLDEDRDIRIALEQVAGLDAEGAVAALDDPAVIAAYEADRACARTAEGGPTAFQGKAADTDGKVRFTAPSLVFEGSTGSLEAGGFQSVEAYDVLIANLDRTLDRRPAPGDPVAVLEHSRRGLVTQEIAAVMADGNDQPDRERAEAGLIDLAAAGLVRRVALGDDALWVWSGGDGPIEVGAGSRMAATEGR